MFEVRAVRAEEWQQVRDLRIEALRDEVAAIAFSGTVEEAAGRSDEFWQERAASSSETAGPDARQRAIVAVDETGRWIGTLTVIISEPGEADFAGQIVDERTANVVGVYVSPAARGRGTIQTLLDAGSEWARNRGLLRLRLLVHPENPRAQRAYAKSGFVATGIVVYFGAERELEMIKTLA